MSSRITNEEYFDQLFDEVQDPLLSEYGGFGMIGFMESLINSSINSCEHKEHLIDSLDFMRKSEVEILMAELKDNQVHRDCKEQFKEMCQKGVFKKKIK